MVSALWKACSEGDLDNVHQLLKEATSVDIEIKDHTGVTPLIAAIQNGHVEIVRALLDKGADPTNASSQGRPDQLTADATILGLLSSNQNASAQNGQEPVEEVSGVPEHNYSYGPSHVSYGYYGPPPPLPEGAQYYPPPPPPAGAEGHSPNGGLGNLPPPEIARFIPCRYFPACRYGASCMFLHPGQTPYYQGPPPPQHQYMAPYEPMQPQPFSPSYYPPPPSFQSPPHGPLPGHARPPSEAIITVQAPFSPNGVPPVPYPPMSPTAYAHPGQPPVPMSISPLPPMPPPGSLPSQSPPNIYNPAPNPVAGFDGPVPYPPNHIAPADVPPTGINGDAQSVLNGPADAQSLSPGLRGDGQHRRGGIRRTSFPSRKQPCLFFPAGKCKNGDDCRFPHVLPDVSGPPQNYFAPRNNVRTRQNNIHANGFGNLNEKFTNMNVREAPNSNHQQSNQTHESSRTSSTDSTRQRFQPGPKNHHHNHNHHTGTAVRNNIEKRPQGPPKQRLPNPDDFPTLAGSGTPSTKSPVANGWTTLNGPTAAQVLQAPAPTKYTSTSASTSKDASKEPSTRGTTPDSTKGTPIKVEPNGISNGVVNGTPVNVTPVHDQPAPKLPVSFAAAAAAPELSKEITLAA